MIEARARPPEVIDLPLTHKLVDLVRLDRFYAPIGRRLTR
jgi:hypothetical protein